jgi:tetratricopeptide (TPR) repeat protein
MNCKKFESLIEDYLTGKMDESLMESFERHYFECDSCFIAVKAEEILHQKQFEVNIKEKPEKKTVRFPGWAWGLAAACLIILVSVPVLFQGDENQLIQNLSQFDPPIYYKSESRNIENAPSFQLAMDLYRQKEYVSAIQALNKIPDETFNPQIHFYKGISFLMTSKPKNAIDQFDRIITEMDPSYFDEAIYYKGIAFLRLGKKKQAVQQFEMLTDMFSPFKQKARSILDQLK